MGHFGFGITQSEKYMEIYQKFMREYDAGHEVDQITREILDDYQHIDPQDEGLMHSVYFALARAQWMCGELSADIAGKVREIILSGRDIQLFTEGNGDKKAVDSRKKSLQKFLQSLEHARETPRKRRPPVKKKELPIVGIGDILLYKWGNKERVAVILDQVAFGKWKPMLFCCLLAGEYKKAPDIDKLLTETVSSWGIYDAESFLTKSQIRIIGRFPVPPQRYKTLFGNTLVYGSRGDFYKEASLSVKALTLWELLFSEDYQQIRRMTHT